MPDQKIEDGKVSVQVSHFSIYILLNKVEFDEVWKNEIRPPENYETSSLDVVFVIDYSLSMEENDPSQMCKQVSKDFISKLKDGTDRAAVVKFIRQATLVSALTTDKDELNKAIDGIVWDSGRTTYSGTDGSTGLKMALDQLDNSDASYKYVVFLTDGEDNQYSFAYTSLINRAVENNVTVYTIGLGNSIEETTLRKIANETGGKYYLASASIDLDDIYDDISFETVDYTTDSNNDGISDYYTKLLNDGKIPLPTGSFELFDVLGIYGETSDDWDGDGLKNGEEIEICVVGSHVYAKMTSHPLLADSDFDGFSDSTEKALGTPPMKFTSGAYASLNNLEDDNLYVYIDVANDSGLIAGINAFFDWQKRDEAKEQLIDYFYEYASKETIDNNQEKITELKLQEEYLKYAQTLVNVAKTVKNVVEIADDVSGMVEGIAYDGEAKEFIDAAREKKIKIKGASAQIRSARKKILDAMNSNQFSDEDVLKTVISDVNTTISVFEEFDGLLKDYNTASFVKELSSRWLTVTSGVAEAVGTVKTCYNGFKYMKLNTGYKAISKGYKEFLKEKGGISTSTYVGVALDVVDMFTELKENSITYGKMQANRDAYIAYIDLLYYITENASKKYDRVAAEAIVQIIEDYSWETYEKQLNAAQGKTVFLTALSIVVDIASDICPHVKVAKSAYAIAKLTISVTGLSNNAKLYVSCRTMQAVSDGCIYIINSNIEKDMYYISYDTYAIAYMTQLAQCRLVGEDYAKQRMLKGDLAAILARWYDKTGKEDIERMFKALSGSIYSNAANLKLTLSSNLPYYDEFNSPSGSGSFGGGGGGGSR